MASISSAIYPPQKRLKVRPATLADQQPPQFAIPSNLVPQPARPPTPSTKPVVAESAYVESPEAVIPAVLPPSLKHLVSSYSLATMSIQTSSRIKQKVRTLLQHLSRFSFADLEAKPGVVALHARSEAANKLVSVVEITKREVEGESGKWWQYTRLSGEERELKEKTKKKNTNGVSLEEWEEGMSKERGSVTGEREGAGPEKEVVTDEVSMENGGDDSEEEEENAFEPPSDRKAHPEKMKKKIRTLPVLTIYMSRVPLPDFRTEFQFVHFLILINRRYAKSVSQ